MPDTHSPETQSPNSAGPLRIAIVAWQALPAIMPDTQRNIGGLELGAWRLAKSLAALANVESQIIVRTPQSVSRSVFSSNVIDGVEVTMYSNPREYARREFAASFEQGFRLSRLSPKLLWQIPYLALTWPWRQRDPPPMEPDPRLIDYQPDVWIALGASRESAGVIATARAQSKPSILMIQSNADLDPRYIGDAQSRNAYGELGAHCLFAIQNATEVVCQTNQQLDLLQKFFDRDGVVVRNATDAAPWQAAAQTPGDYVLWVGRYDRFHKRPHLAIEIATRLPDIPFRMIANDSDDEVRQEIQAKLPANVTLLDYVPFDKLPSEFGQSRIFLSTGSAQYEGFPTVLLHAVAAKKPIVSLDDFDDFIVESSAGKVCGDVERASAAIREYWDRPESHAPVPSSDYLRQHHTTDAVATQMVDVAERCSRLEQRIDERGSGR